MVVTRPVTGTGQKVKGSKTLPGGEVVGCSEEQIGGWCALGSLHNKQSDEYTARSPNVVVQVVGQGLCT